MITPCPDGDRSKVRRSRLMLVRERAYDCAHMSCRLVSGIASPPYIRWNRETLEPRGGEHPGIPLYESSHHLNQVDPSNALEFRTGRVDVVGRFCNSTRSNPARFHCSVGVPLVCKVRPSKISRFRRPRSRSPVRELTVRCARRDCSEPRQSPTDSNPAGSRKGSQRLSYEPGGQCSKWGCVPKLLVR